MYQQKLNTDSVRPTKLTGDNNHSFDCMDWEKQSVLEKGSNVYVM